MGNRSTGKQIHGIHKKSRQKQSAPKAKQIYGFPHDMDNPFRLGIHHLNQQFNRRLQPTWPREVAPRAPNHNKKQPTTPKRIDQTESRLNTEKVNEPMPSACFANG
jgi:hypothetical protein